MHVNLVDQYVRGTSTIHRLDTRVKVTATLLLILSVSLMPAGKWVAFAFLWAITLVLTAAAGIPIGSVLRRSLIALPFALAALTLLVTVPGPPLLELPRVGWTVSEPGLVRFASILLKSWLSVQIAIILAATTHLTDLLWALNSLHVPRLLIAIISFMYRYLFVLAGEGFRMARARQARSAAPAGSQSTGGNLAWRARVTGWMVGQLFLRSYERSERVYQAMAARGYRGQIRRLDPPPLSPRDLMLGALPVTAYAVILAAANWC